MSKNKFFFQETIFHYVHKDDRETALQFCCDFRRYRYTYEGYINDMERNHPIFFSSFHEIMNYTCLPLNCINVLILKTLTQELKSQCDYYIEYLVEFY